MMKRVALGILLFGSIWGVLEVYLGETLYAADFRFPSVPINILALGVLAAARALFPQAGTSLAIGCCAILYKLAAMHFGIAGTPVYLCHLLGIFCLGLSFEVFFGVLPRTMGRAAAADIPAVGLAALAAAAAYVSYALFAFSITYLFRYEPWVASGLPKVARHIGVAGTLAALGGAILVPLSVRLVRRAKQARPAAWPLGSRLGAGAAAAVTAALWVIAIFVRL